MSLVDAASTLFLSTFGGKEGGIWAEPVYKRYGQFGLMALSIFAFFSLLGCVWFFKYAKTRITQGETSKPNRAALAVAVNLFFLGEAYLIGVVVQNFFGLLFLPSITLLAIQYGVTLAYFVFIIYPYSSGNETAHKRLNMHAILMRGHPNLVVALSAGTSRILPGKN